MRPSRNVLGGVLAPCSNDPLTGFYRNGCCDTDREDAGSHTICTQVTDDFLGFTAACGNDLTNAAPQLGFPGLKAGDRWCVCAGRWKEALEAGLAPPVILEATHEAALEVVSLEDLLRHAIDAPKV
jgi:hypothetical protein